MATVDAARRDDQFLDGLRARLGPAFIAAMGSERGREAFAEAMAWAWEHRARLAAMEFPAAYLFRVGHTRSRWVTKRSIALFPAPARVGLPDVEPGLVNALGRLSERQRVCVVLVHVYEWTLSEVADLLGIGKSTVQTHTDRGLQVLRDALGDAHDF